MDPFMQAAIVTFRKAGAPFFAKRRVGDGRRMQNVECRIANETGV